MKEKLISIFTSVIFLIPAPTALLAAPSVLAPSNLNAVAVSTTQIDLVWQDNAGNETGFKVERSPDGITFSEIANMPYNSVSYSDTGLPEGTTHYYRVRAYKVTGNKTIYSAYSNVDSAKTLSSPPAAPTNLTAALETSFATSTIVMLSWTDNANNETGFVVQLSYDGVNFGNIGFPSANITSFEHLVANGSTYHYRVKAQNASGSSGYSNIASIIVP